MTLSILGTFYFDTPGRHDSDFLFDLPIAAPHPPSSHLLCCRWPAFSRWLHSHLLQWHPWGVFVYISFSLAHYHADCQNCVRLGLNRWWFLGGLLHLWHLWEEEIIGLGIIPALGNLLLSHWESPVRWIKMLPVNSGCEGGKQPDDNGCLSLAFGSEPGWNQSRKIWLIQNDGMTRWFITCSIYFNE